MNRRINDWILNKIHERSVELFLIEEDFQEYKDFHSEHLKKFI